MEKCFPHQRSALEKLQSLPALLDSQAIAEFLPPSPQTIPLRLGLELHSCEFSLSDKSQDLLLAPFTIETLRMEELYMFFSEARRVVKLGGHLALAGLMPGKNALERIRSYFWRKAHPVKALELTHYLSPEDWLSKEHIKYSTGLLRTEMLLLQRLN